MLKDNNRGPATSEALKDGFSKVIDTLSGEQVFDKEALKKLAKIDSALSWHKNSPTLIATKMEVIRSNKVVWKLRTKNVIIPQHTEIPTITQALKDYKARMASTQQMPTLEEVYTNPNTQPPQW